MAHPIGDGRFSDCIAHHKLAHGKEKKKSVIERNRG
jgi:hypothetical protein